MKKFISVILCVCICLSSTVFCFADFTSTDSTTLSNIYKYMPTASQVTTLNNTLSTINTRVLNIYNALFSGNHSIAYWVEAINSWMSPIYGRLSDIITNTLNIEAVAGLLGSTDVVNGTTVRTPYLAYDGKGVAEINNEFLTSWNTNRNYAAWSISPNGVVSSLTPGSYGYADGLVYSLNNIVYMLARSYDYNYRYLATSFGSTQTTIDWTTLGNKNFSPSSMANGLYQWLSNIQAPVARLSYVLASDERIEAQEKAAANEEAVVDNFIDSSGSGAASTSDFGSVSDLSSGFKNNISTDASVSGIWNIFNSDNFGWFSQETADQLDTTGSGNRTLRSSGSYPTPLLDKQTEDIMNILGGDDND